MCWRIVRIDGNGNTKLVLYNYNSSDCTITGNTLAFARYSEENGFRSVNDFIFACIQEAIDCQMSRGEDGTIRYPENVVKHS